MRNTYYSRLAAIFALLFLYSVTSPAENSSDYVVTVGSEQLHFIAQPQAGYVLKTRDDIDSMNIVSRFLKNAGDVKISPIRGLGRKGVFVVYNERSADENNKTIKSLGDYSEVQYAAPLFSSTGETVAIIPEIVVRVKPGTQIEQVRTLCETAGCKIIKRMEFTKQEYLIDVTGIDADAVFTAMEQLNENSFVEWAAPNTAFQPKLCNQAVPSDLASGEQLRVAAAEDANSPGVYPNDEYFPMQWHLHNSGQSGGTPGADIRAPEAWEITTGDPNIVVAVIDTGVDTMHPDLVDNLVPGYDFVDNDDDPTDEFCHGVLCAGLIAARGNNGIGITGVTWNCRIMPIRIFGGFRPDGTVFGNFTSSDYATALRWAATHGADILTNTWGDWNSPKPVVQSALADATRPGGIGRGGKGCLVFWVAGNESGPLTYYPRRYPEVIAVGATDHNDLRCQYSNYGPELDIVAPSAWQTTIADWNNTIGSLWTTDISGPDGWNYPEIDPNIMDYTYTGGTSSSCPIAAGVAALILSVDPNLTNLEVQKILYRSARDLGEPGWDQFYGWGRVDARAAVEMALNRPPLYVDDDAPNDPGPGDPNISDPYENGSAEHPFDSIQAGIDAAVDGETVLVAPGEYVITEPITFRGKAITVLSEAGPDETIIRMGTPADSNRGTVVVFENNETDASVLEGFTITGGRGLWDASANNWGGGGIAFNASSGIVRNCDIVQNSTKNGGGVMVYFGSSTTLANCIIRGNSATGVTYGVDGYGGGLFCGMSSLLTMTNCTITGNSAVRGGGGLLCGENSLLTMTHCVIMSNTVQYAGGGIACDYGSAILTNCVIARNTGASWGGGVACVWPEASMTIRNCTIWGNSATEGGGVGCFNGGSVTVSNSILWGNTGTTGSEIFLEQSPTRFSISYSDVASGQAGVNVEGGCTLDWGVGNIDVDPLFADAENCDYHLKSQAGRWDPNSESWILDDVTSLCIDAGDPNSDWSGEIWPHGGRINMGAYGGTREASMSTQPQPMSLPRIAYINGSDAEAAKSFQALLIGYGCPTTLVGLDQAPAAALEDYELVIVGDDTEDAAAWKYPQVADAIEGAGRPIVGMGEGGYDFFGMLGLSIGRPNGMHGDGDSISVIDPNHPLFIVPYAIEIPEDRVLRLYTQSKNATLHLPLVPETVTPLAGDAAYPGYYPLALEHDRYLLWGFTESPQKMTEVGKTLFINVVVRTANKAWESEN